MKKLCFILTTLSGVLFFYTTAFSAAVMTPDEFKNSVQAQSQQTQERLNQELKQRLATKPSGSGSGQPSSPGGLPGQTPPQNANNAPPPPPGANQPPNSPYTGFGNAPKSTTPPPASTGNTGSGWNINY